MRVAFRILTAALLLCLTAASAFTELSAPDYWPTDGWRISTPEEQGMDSALLAEMLESIIDHGYNIRSVIVIRNGYIVTEVYIHPFREDMRHIIHSCSKSVTSALVGVAIDKGFIEGVDEPVLDFFPGIAFANADGRKRSMTLEHLLTMSSGLDVKDSYKYGFRGLVEMRMSEDWLQHVLDLPMRDEPGTRFEYSNGVTYVLSAIIQEQTGMNAFAFAREHLFGPLGIVDVTWEENLQGITFGWGGIRIRPRDLAKVAFCYLHGGTWEDRRIIPRKWVKASTTKRIDAGTLSEGYGYQWWIDAEGYYMMIGYSGQFAFVVPAEKLVVVFNSCLHSHDFYVPEEYLYRYVIPAVKSKKPLPGNPDGRARLASLVESLERPAASLVPALPERAREISGRTFEFDFNPIGYQTMTLSFEPGADEAVIDLFYSPGHLHAPIGLDGVYRVVRATGFWRAFKGSWENDSAFVMEYHMLDSTERGEARITVEDRRLRVNITEAIQGRELEVIARPVKREE